MAKRFRLRISRVIPSFQFCQSKDPTTLPEDPVPTLFFRPPFPATSKPIPTVDIPALVTPPSKPSPPLPQQPHRSSFRRHVSSAFISVGCGGSPAKHDSSLKFRWRKEEKWHVIAKVSEQAPRRKIYNSSASGGSDDGKVLPRRPPSTAEKKKRRARKKRPTARIGMSTSSADSGLFSSDAGDVIDQQEETETLVSSSRSFSTDSSSEHNPHLETIRETPNPKHHNKKKTKKKPKKSSKRCISSKSTSTIGGGGSRGGYRVMTGMCRTPEWESPARLSVLKRLIPCTVDGKVTESFAIVKKSEDPYEDFKRSMMEMILEKQMFDEEDLEQLLQCFLSLNSWHHHAMILEAFSDIWDALFCSTPPLTAATARVLRAC